MAPVAAVNISETLVIAQQSTEDFLTHLAVTRDVSRHTVRAYARDLADWCLWAKGAHGELDGVPVQQWGRLYLRFLAGRSLARSSQARKLSCWQSYLKFLAREGYLPEAVVSRSTRSPKPLQRLPQFLTQAQLQQLFDCLSAQRQANPQDPITVRNQAIVALLYSSGLRVGELEQLTFDAIDWDAGECRVVGKGSRERIAFMSPDALAFLTDWKACWPSVRARCGKVGKRMQQPGDPVWLNWRGTPLTQRSVHRLVVALGQQAGLQRPLHPHQFRHTFATHLLNNGVELRLVQELLGHANIRNTQIYTHVTTDRLRQAYLKAHPLALHPA